MLAALEQLLLFFPAQLVILFLSIEIVALSLSWVSSAQCLRLGRSALVVMAVSVMGSVLFYVMVTYFPDQTSLRSLAAQSRILLCIQAVAVVILLHNYWRATLVKVRDEWLG